MAIPNPFHEWTVNTRCKWGYVFELTPQHMSLEQMNPMKQSYDKLADSCVTRLQELQRPKSSDDSKTNSTSHIENGPVDKPNGHHPHSDLLTTFKEHYYNDPVLSKLWAEVTTVPSWVSYPQLERGQQVFYRYGGANLTGLAFQSLLGGLGGSRVVEVLARTGGFATPVARRRLYETTQFILQVTRTIDDLRVGGDGWNACIRVRFLHAMMRMRMLKLAKKDPEYYSVDVNGVPSNDLDSIATIATFSSTLIFQSLPRQGLFLTKQEKEDYVALWRYVGFLLGTPVDGFFDTVGNARRTLESLILHEINPSETSRVLAHNMLASITGVPPLYAHELMLAATARWLNGHALCDALDIARPSFYWYFLMAGQCLFFMVNCYLTRLIPAWDIRKQRIMREHFWIMIVTSKTGLGGKEAKYEFKHIPKVGKTTVRAAREEKEEAKGVERRNFIAAVIGTMLLLVIVWISWIMFKGMLFRILRIKR